MEEARVPVSLGGALPGQRRLTSCPQAPNPLFDVDTIWTQGFNPHARPSWRCLGAVDILHVHAAHFEEALLEQLGESRVSSHVGLTLDCIKPGWLD